MQFLSHKQNGLKTCKITVYKNQIIEKFENITEKTVKNIYFNIFFNTQISQYSVLTKCQNPV
jgi:hypothetical protein